LSRSLRFEAAEDNRRPFGSHQFYVWSPKIGRRLKLFGDVALNTWIAIEADVEIVAFCERPLVILTQKPARVVDFWVQRTTGEVLWLLQRPRENRAEQGNSLSPSFRSWAHNKGMTVRQLLPDELALDEPLRRNWGTVLRYLAANRALVKPALLDCVRETCLTTVTLDAIEQHYPSEDPVLVRTAVFCLFQQGLVRSPAFAETPIGPASRFETNRPA
jgi:hypothetical protein